jgi:hypothetical protein
MSNSVTLTVGECRIRGHRFAEPYLEVAGTRIVLTGPAATRLGQALMDRARLAVSTADNHPSRQGVTQVHGEYSDDAGGRPLDGTV